MEDIFNEWKGTGAIIANGQSSQDIFLTEYIIYDSESVNFFDEFLQEGVHYLTLWRKFVIRKYKDYEYADCELIFKPAFADQPATLGAKLFMRKKRDITRPM